MEYRIQQCNSSTFIIIIIFLWQCFQYQLYFRQHKQVNICSELPSHPTLSLVNMAHSHTLTNYSETKMIYTNWATKRQLAVLEYDHKLRGSSALDGDCFLQTTVLLGHHNITTVIRSGRICFEATVWKSQ